MGLVMEIKRKVFRLGDYFKQKKYDYGENVGKCWMLSNKKKWIL